MPHELAFPGDSRFGRGPRSTSSQVWNDSLGDGFPDAIRLESGQDRHNFIHWFTFLAEAPYYAPSRQAQEEVQDCAGLIRYAYRNALLPHTAAWRRSAALPFEPGFGDIAKFAYPRWPLARALFRTRSGPLRPDDLDQGAFSEFADAATLLNYNTFFVSKDIRAAQPGDLIFFHQPTQREPFHTMLFVGSSYFQPAGADWVVYHTGDLDGRRGKSARSRWASCLLTQTRAGGPWRLIHTFWEFIGSKFCDKTRWEVLTASCIRNALILFTDFFRAGLHGAALCN